jgi:hypothetical protein
MTNKKKKPSGKKAPNQFLKGLSRLKKVTVGDALVRRFVNWVADEENADTKQRLKAVHEKLEQAEALRKEAVQIMEGLGDYNPPVRNHTGELKLAFGRKVWIKPQFKSVYDEAYTPDQLQQLHVLKVVNGRVVLLLGAFDPNNTDAMARAVAPKIHLTATAPEA